MFGCRIIHLLTYSHLKMKQPFSNLMVKPHLIKRVRRVTQPPKH